MIEGTNKTSAGNDKRKIYKSLRKLKESKQKRKRKKEACRKLLQQARSIQFGLEYITTMLDMMNVIFLIMK